MCTIQWFLNYSTLSTYSNSMVANVTTTSFGTFWSSLKEILEALSLSVVCLRLSFPPLLPPQEGISYTLRNPMSLATKEQWTVAAHPRLTNP